jgi:hypothetical protein
MEKVKVVKAIPGILNVGDVLVSPCAGEDFVLSEAKVTKRGSSERFVSLDYVTVSENIPTFFNFEETEEECDCTDCTCDKELQLDLDNSVRSDKEIGKRYEFFKERFEVAYPGSEEQVVYKNLMWFIEWLQGRVNLV